MLSTFPVYEHGDIITAQMKISMESSNSIAVTDRMFVPDFLTLCKVLKKKHDDEARQEEELANAKE